MNENLTIKSLVKLEKTDSNRFRIVAYSGAVVDRAYGKIVIDIQGISSKPKMPVFQQHDPTLIVGYTEKAFIENNSFIVEGVFSSTTEAAKTVKSLLKEGFPWQASIGVSPKQVLQVKTGETIPVNDVVVSGPCELWVKAEVFEVSFVPLGADSNTAAEALSTTHNNAGEVDAALIEWQGDAALREEFSHDYQAWAAYRNAVLKGCGKVYSGRGYTSSNEGGFK